LIAAGFQQNGSWHKEKKERKARNQRRPHCEQEFISSEQPFRTSGMLRRKERLQKLSPEDLTGKGWGRRRRLGKLDSSYSPIESFPIQRRILIDPPLLVKFLNSKLVMRAW